MNPATIPSQFGALQKLLTQQPGTPGAAILNQQTPASPSAPPNNIPPTIQPQGSPMPSAAQQTPQGTGLPAGDPEALIITKGLLARQKALGATGQ